MPSLIVLSLSGCPTEMHLKTVKCFVILSRISYIFCHKSLLALYVADTWQRGKPGQSLATWQPTHHLCLCGGWCVWECVCSVGLLNSLANTWNKILVSLFQAQLNTEHTLSYTFAHSPVYTHTHYLFRHTHTRTMCSTSMLQVLQKLRFATKIWLVLFYSWVGGKGREATPQFIVFNLKLVISIKRCVTVQEHLTLVILRIRRVKPPQIICTMM